jgi:Fungal protein of unknown function (DUF1752)
MQFPSFEGTKPEEDHNPGPVEEPESFLEQDTTPPHEGLHKVPSSEVPQAVNDDQAIEDQPTRHVDYLSHDWREEDIWSSWRYIVARRNVYSNSVRLENASWRTWTKVKYNLKTISPETLNWFVLRNSTLWTCLLTISRLKDCDVTWLYGPLQSDSRKCLNPANSPPPSRLSTSSSFIDKKPILKKKSASQVILQRSISSNSLLKQAGAMLQAQQAGPTKGRPSYERSSSEFSLGTFSRGSVANTPAGDDSLSSVSTRYSVTSSGLQSPSERRHIHFNNEVEQCIAVESKEDEEGEEEEPHTTIEDDEDDDEGIVMMKKVPSKAKLSNRSTPRNSFSNESKTIKPLPSTTLKYRGDTPEPNEAQQTRGMNRFWPVKKTLSPSPSQETLRPSRPQANFLLDDDDEDVDVQWQPSSCNGTSSVSYDKSSPHHSDPPSEDEYDPGPGMRRTPSGMFMPYDEDEEEAAMNHSLFGRVVDTVNTARDIAHVIWNVGWRR